MSLQFPAILQYNKVTLTLTHDEVFVEFKRNLSLKKIKAFMKEYELQIVQPLPVGIPKKQIDPKSSDKGKQSHRYWFLIPDSMTLDMVLEKLKTDDRVTLANPVYHRADLLPSKTALTFSDTLLVRFKPQTSKKKIQQSIKNLDAIDKLDKNRPFDGLLRCIKIKDTKNNAIEVAEAFKKMPEVKRAGPSWIQLYSIPCAIPDDTLFSDQWHLNQINAIEGWDITQGHEDIIIAILDSGCDLSHEDLSGKLVSAELYRNVIEGEEGNLPSDHLGHGTCCAGIVAAHTNNELGVSGVAWGCRLMPIRTHCQRPLYANTMETEEEYIISGLAWAMDHGAHVISFSDSWSGPQEEVDSMITDVIDAGIVIVASTGNYGYSIGYPARNPLVMAVGASTRTDQRRTGSGWHSIAGPELSVMAPGENIWTTDISGEYGYNSGNYYSFSGTSAATPIVAGLVALLRAHYLGTSFEDLTSAQIRAIIEKTADKVGGYLYEHLPEYSNGTWNQEMGYGRINVLKALDFADVYIKDNQDDSGSVFYDGNFYSRSDLIVSTNDSLESDEFDTYLDNAVQQGFTNYIYVRVHNSGPALARSVRVSSRAIPFRGTEFIYPDDWSDEDEFHICPHDEVVLLEEPLAPGDVFIARFRLSADQIERLCDWEGEGWHCCLVAQVQCENDHYQIPDGAHTWQNNNIAQRNLTIYEMTHRAPSPFSFLAGHKRNNDLYMELIVDRKELPEEIKLFIDPWDSRQVWDLGQTIPGFQIDKIPLDKSVTFLDKSRLALDLCGCKSILTLEAGSSIKCAKQCAGSDNRKISLQGASFVIYDGKQIISVHDSQATIGLQKYSGEVVAMSLMLQVPNNFSKGKQYKIDIVQRNTKSEVVGGIAFIVKT